MYHDQATDPHLQFVLRSVLLFYGRKQTGFLRTHKRWQPLIPLLIDNISADSGPRAQDTYAATNPSGLHWSRGAVIPIETKIRILSVRLLYEICRVQKFTYTDLSKAFQLYLVLRAHTLGQRCLRTRLWITCLTWLSRRGIWRMKPSTTPSSN